MDEGARTCTGCARELAVDAFPVRGRRCLDCRRAAGRRHYADNRAYYVAKAKRRNAATVADVRVWLDAYLLTHPCVDCGIDDPRVLEFDHRDPTTKLAPVANLARWGYALGRVRTRSPSATCGAPTATGYRRTASVGGGGPGDGPFDNR